MLWINILADKTPKYIKEEIFFNPKGMSQLRINQFTTVQIPIPYAGEAKEVKMSQKLLSALKEHSAEGRNRYKNYDKFCKRDINPSNHITLESETTDPKILKLQKKYRKNIRDLADQSKYMSELVKSVANF